ncbi:MAG: hypothetical protein WC916_00340 [Candidatus Woesearchaeota archaeon]
MKKIIPILTLAAFMGFYGCNNDSPKIENKGTLVHQETLEEKTQREAKHATELKEKQIDSLRDARVTFYGNLIGRDSDLPAQYEQVYGILPTMDGNGEFFSNSRYSSLKDTYGGSNYTYKGTLEVRTYIDPELMDSTKNKTTTIDTEGWTEDKTSRPGTWIKHVNVTSAIDTAKKEYRLSVHTADKIITYNCTIEPDFTIEKIEIAKGNQKRTYEREDVDHTIWNEQERLFNLYLSALDRTKREEILKDFK